MKAKKVDIEGRSCSDEEFEEAVRAVGMLTQVNAKSMTEMSLNLRQVIEHFMCVYGVHLREFLAEPEFAGETFLLHMDELKLISFRKVKKVEECTCFSCIDEFKLEGAGGLPLNAFVMIVCPLCGNKRCPHANNHRFDCTNSNEPGQKGSAYG